MSNSLKLCADHRVQAMPCPRVLCRYHLADLAPPGTPLDKLGATCALAVADQGPLKQETLAGLLGVSRETVATIEASAKGKLRENEAMLEASPPDFDSCDRPESENVRDRILRILRAGMATREDIVARGVGAYQTVNEALNRLRREGRVRNPSRNIWGLA